MKNIAIVVKELGKNCSEVMVGITGFRFCCLFKYYSTETDLKSIYKEVFKELSCRNFFKLELKQYIQEYGYYGYMDFTIRKAGVYKF